MKLEQEGESTMSSGSEPTNVGNSQPSDETNEEARNTGGKSPGVGMFNTLDATPEQRVGNAGQFGPENPETVAENVKTTKAAFSSGSKPADKGQRESPAETETTDYGQTDTNYRQTDTPGS